MKHTDPIFYVTSPTSEIVWSQADYNFYVIRNGEMRISDGENIARYTEDLAKIGIYSEGDFDFGLDDGKYEDWATPWFEVCDKTDPTWSSDPIFDLDDAIAMCVNFEEVNA